jgi:hypothetical protein
MRPQRRRGTRQHPDLERHRWPVERPTRAVGGIRGRPHRVGHIRATRPRGPPYSPALLRVQVLLDHRDDGPIAWSCCSLSVESPARTVSVTPTPRTVMPQPGLPHPPRRNIRHVHGLGLRGPVTRHHRTASRHARIPRHPEPPDRVPGRLIRDVLAAVQLERHHEARLVRVERAAACEALPVINERPDVLEPFT